MENLSPNEFPTILESTYLDTYNNYHEQFYPGRLATNHSLAKAAPRTFSTRVRRCAHQRDYLKLSYWRMYFSYHNN